MEGTDDDDQVARPRTRPAEPTWSHRYRHAVEPGADGLPRARVVLVPLLLLAVVLVALVALGITGTSTGETRKILNGGSAAGDPQLLLGSSRAIRSDEWFVQTPWTISQVQQGMPRYNQTFPGGWDATVQHDLPSKDWSALFRPHLWGFFVLPLDNAMAVKWWLPGFSMIAACFLFAVTMVPRRPVGAFALAVGFFFAPFFQWWYLSITFWPVAWALVTMTGAVWMLRRPGWRTAVPWAAGASYLAVTTGVGIYAPYIIPCALIAAAFGVGAVVDGLGSSEERFAGRLKRVSPILVGGILGCVVLGLWALTRIDALRSFTETVYPGARITPPGTGASLEQSRDLFSAPTQVELNDTTLLPRLSSNQSEASTFYLPGLFLAPAVLWLLWWYRKHTGRIDAVLAAVCAITIVILAFLYVPGWEPLAKILTLDRTTEPRIRLGVGLVAVVLVVVVASRIDGIREGRRPIRVPWSVVGLCVLTALAVNVAVFASLIGATPPWKVGALAFAVAAGYVVCVAASARAAFTVAGVALLAVSIVTGAWVNPLYRGVYDLRDTALVQSIHELDATAGRSDDTPTRWVGMGLVPTVALVESGVRSYSGFQSSPSPRMWEQIDPSAQFEDEWNRLALVSWSPGKGGPHPDSPPGYNDSVRNVFDSCARFAQREVTYVVSDIAFDQRCLDPAETVQVDDSQFFIYRVTPKRQR